MHDSEEENEIFQTEQQKTYSIIFHFALPAKNREASLWQANLDTCLLVKNCFTYKNPFSFHIIKKKFILKWEVSNWYSKHNKQVKSLGLCQSL